MADVYEEAYYHLVWATTRRETMILPRTEEMLYSYIRQKCRDKKAFVYALNGMADHIHLVCSIPATLAVCEFVKAVKGSASHFAGHHPDADPVRWQRGYSYHTLAKRDLPAWWSMWRTRKSVTPKGVCGPRWSACLRTTKKTRSRSDRV